MRALIFLVVLVGCDKKPDLVPDASSLGSVDAAAPVVDASVACADDIRIFTSPAAPWTGAPLRVMAISDQPLDNSLEVGTASSAERHGGPPYFWAVEIASPPAGALSASLKGCGSPTSITVGTTAPPSPSVPDHGVWASPKAWSHDYENLYSAWIEHLFDAKNEDEPSWAALHEVMRDPKRNWLYDHLGAAEDSGPRAPLMKPDCADLPYFLRAYFAFKQGLPVGIATCNRGGGGLPPSCHDLLTNEDDDARVGARKKDGAIAMFGAFVMGTLADRAHSGSARTPFTDDGSDYYPVALDWANLRPGTVYADPYGHTLLVAKRIPQDDQHGGVLYAVDGQPDGTVARKRFWRGNFLYAVDPALGGPGFKRLRPVVRKDGALVRARDAYGDLSMEASKLDVEGFYDRMDDVLSPKPLDPERALMETLAALEEQVRTRVKSVDNGRKFLDKHGPPATMPEGAEIFETTGAWEDYSTPARDLRILIAIDVARGFPARVVRRKERYAIPAVMPDLQKILDRELASRSIVYTRTDASSFTLTLAEVLSRSASLEMAYDPNDCPEIRWGAPEGSSEMSTCKAHAPADQRAKMDTYRSWFHDRKRPPRK